MSAVHKDFHGALSYGFQHIYDHFGPDALDAYLQRVGERCYADLIAEIRKRGLPALEEHWRRVFDLEEADYEILHNDNQLVLRVNECPALSHMRKSGYAVFHDYCRHTRIVNKAICRAAGVETSVESNQQTMRCEQRFWMKEAAQ